MKLKFFELAKRISYKSDHVQHKMACVLVNKNKVLNVGHNQNKTHPFAKTRYNTLHAEISALIGMGYEDLKGCDAYIYRQTKIGELGMARPCPACYLALKSVGIKNIYYSSPEGYVQEKL